MALTYIATASIEGTNSKVFEGQTLNHDLSFKSSNRFTDGTAVNEATLVWVDKDRSLAATTEEIDLSSTLTDAFGDAVNFVKVTSVFIKNKNTAIGENLKVGGAAANAFLLFDNATDIYTIGPNGVLFIVDPSDAAKTVTAGTGDLLKLDAGAATIVYDIAICGR